MAADTATPRELAPIRTLGNKEYSMRFLSILNLVLAILNAVFVPLNLIAYLDTSDPSFLLRAVISAGVAGMCYYSYTLTRELSK